MPSRPHTDTDGHETDRCRAGVSVLAVVALVAVSQPAPAAQVVLDRVVAVVNGSVITLTDVQAAIRFGLVTPDKPDDLRSAIERVIDRRLALVEVERYAPAEPPAERLEAAMAEARGRFASDAAFAAALAETGLTPEQLRRHLRDDLHRQAYEQQRFGFALHPSDEETLAYYRAHPERFRRDGVVPPYEGVQADVRGALIAEKRADLIRDWIAGVRRRADVTILPD